MPSRTNLGRRLRHDALGVALAGLLSTGLATDAAADPPQTCPAWQNGGELTGHIANEKVVESSGLAASRRHDNLFWNHNDSGDDPLLYLHDAKGKDRGTLRLKGADSEDWEDIAIGPCEEGTDEACVYVGDFGDNDAERDSVTLYKFPEPDPPEDPAETEAITDWERIDYVYEQGPRNAETLLVHPTSAKIYVVEKAGADHSAVYRVPNRPTEDEEKRRANKIAEMKTSSGLGRLVTGGDIAPDGRELSVRTYVKVYTYCLPEDAPFEEIFEVEPVVSHPRFTLQSEALAYGPDGEVLWFTSEGKSAPLIRMKRLRPDPTE